MHVKRGDRGHARTRPEPPLYRPHFSFPLWDGTRLKQGSRRNYFQIACYTEEQNLLSVSSWDHLGTCLHEAIASQVFFKSNFFSDCESNMCLLLTALEIQLFCFEVSQLSTAQDQTGHGEHSGLSLSNLYLWKSLLCWSQITTYFEHCSFKLNIIAYASPTVKRTTTNTWQRRFMMATEYSSNCLIILLLDTHTLSSTVTRCL